MATHGIEIPASETGEHLHPHDLRTACVYTGVSLVLGLVLLWVLINRRPN